MTTKRKHLPFDYSLDFKTVDFRHRPDLYHIGKGEQGVLLVEPYKSEILMHWRFKTPDVARRSANKIYKMFRAYLAADDFVGADMARKFLQMGYTRSRRYANHKSGRKYDAASGKQLPREQDEVKAESARIFYEKWLRACENKTYLAMMQRHHDLHENGEPGKREE